MFIFSTVLSAEKDGIDSAYKADAALAFEKHCDTVFRLAFIRTGNKADADDVMSDVFLRLIRNIHKNKSSRVGAFIYFLLMSFLIALLILRSTKRTALNGKVINLPMR